MRLGCCPTSTSRWTAPLIRAWASNKSLVPRDGPPPPSSGPRNNPEVDFKGQTRKNDSHVSKTNPDGMLARKSNNEGA